MITKLRDSPLTIDEWPKDIDYFMAVDESGTSEIKSVERMIKNSDNDNINKWFVLSGIIFKKSSMEIIPNIITKLKKKYWKNGEYCGERVVFHSKEMHHRQNAFSNSCIPDYNSFKKDLCESLDQIPFRIITIVIDKYQHVSKNSNPYKVYEYALALLLERYSFNISPNKKGAMLFESRNGGADKELLAKANDTFENGTYYVNDSHFDRVHNGIYFNPKRTSDNKKSYFMLELADLFAYATLQHFRNNEDSDIYCCMKKD